MWKTWEIIKEIINKNNNSKQIETQNTNRENKTQIGKTFNKFFTTID